MSVRTYEEIADAVSVAANAFDVSQLEACVAELEELGTDPALALREFTLGTALTIQNSFRSSTEHFARAEAMFIELGDVNAQASTLTQLGMAWYRANELDLALETWQRGLAISEKIGSMRRVANITCNIGNIYSDLNDSPRAFEQFNKALDLHTELDMKREIGIDLTNLGGLHVRIGDYPEGLRYYHQSIAVHSEIGFRHGIADTTNKIGVAYAFLDQIPAALEYYNQALQMFEEMDMRPWYAFTVGHIGNAHLKNRDYMQAQEYYERAIEIHQQLDLPSFVFENMCDLVEMFCEQGRFDEAERLHNSIQLNQTLLDEQRISYEINHALIQDHNGKRDEALKTLHAALAATRTINSPRKEKELHEKLRDMALAASDLASYVEHNNEFVRINEEINGKDTATRLAMQAAERTLANEREQQAKESERVATEREREQAVLYSTLPKHIADRVIRGEVVNDHYENAAVMFLDIVGFTTLSNILTSQQVVTLLDAVFKVCDEACRQHNVTRIKTIGDSYMAVAFPSLVPLDDSAARCCSSAANTALEIIQQLKSDERVCHPDGGGISVRIGLHCGPVTAGVLGTERLQFDVWGDTVNVASRMESTSEPNRIHVSDSFAKQLEVTMRYWEILEETGSGSEPRTMNTELRGETEVKGKGTMQTYWLEST